MSKRKSYSHIEKSIEYLKSLNVSDIIITKNKHVMLSWVSNKKRCIVACSSTPSNYDMMTKIIRRDIDKEIRLSGLT